MGQEPGEVRQGIERTRADMSDTVDALAHKADVPSRIKESVADKRDRLRQQSVWRIVRQILLARKEPDERAPFLRDVVPNRTSQHRVADLDCIEDCAQRGITLNLERQLAVDARERSEVCRKHYSNHGRVCASTETTAGRSRTIGAQVSPASADAYTCPPVVPKYTPHLSSASTAIASRSTLT